MTLAVIVQARMGSSRLPGKVLEPLGGKSALLRCLDRCTAIPGAGLVLCAVPDTYGDEEVAEEAADAGYMVVRGPEDDVLSRYAKAAREAGADLVMRVTSDCPFIDPVICGRVVNLLHASGADYASNNMPALFPHGLDCEIFPAMLLHEADKLARTPEEREHVTPWIRNHPHLRKANLAGPGGGLERLRWTLDYDADLEFAAAVYAELGEAAAHITAAELAAFCLRRPDIARINARHVDEARLNGGARAELQSEPVKFARAA
ncbi:MAG: glycosyltransferase family protein [Maricaulaceae bacterium]|nr:glycosyltransferase family protein [Maricaulaceae bacterium]